MNLDPSAHHQTQRVEILDGLRFAAALAVLLFHYAFRIWTGTTGVIEYPGLAHVAQYGYLGVDVFFMISGFVILMTASRGSMDRFLVSRVIRLYPAYWVCVLATFLFLTVYHAQDPTSQPSFWTFIVNLSMLQGGFGVEHIDGSYWTLVIELHFYTLILLVLALRGLRYIDQIMGCWLAAGIAADFIPALHQFGDWYAAPWCHYFVAGALAYRMRVAGINVLRLAIYSLAFVQAARHGLWFMNLKHHLTGVDYEQWICVSFITLAFATFFALALGKLEWRHRLLPTIGALTYPLYLIHAAIGATLLRAWVKHGGNRWLGLFVISGLALSAAWGIHRYFEKPLTAWLKHLLMPRLKLRSATSRS